ncbi:MAG: hypothetical protein AVDCRST_MAG74-3844 [uncultured Pyrinomonadaceae bacterium]|uniref:Uncharacterized protein n=1 Tax=uncultured Pyrinomonadaceae bacterium TaxID=2283094 RepID=A0A6J4Q2M3_9BACT|nr:MAG: hypothetical protein AVDCRST_MAG74-3844 [uncultured Pyrinomonadaceae bacterium]
MDETRKINFAVYDLSFETCRHPCRSIHLTGGICQSTQFFSKKPETHSGA